MSKFAIPLLKKSKGTIINISSTRHLQSEADTEPYSASKGAIDALTRAMSISYGPLIRVNSISPGWIHDPKEKLSKKDHDQHPAGRVGIPSDVAKLAAYLASDEAGFITGSDFVIDGGMTAKMIYK
jgi:NAD(P)-dependent dehydrogenase (short-subunit alcohol dehydrogenase family)